MSSGYLDPLQRLLRQEARPPDKYGHQPRLHALTLAIGEELHYDRDVVCAAAWLHDLGVFIGHRPEDLTALSRWDHVAYACSRAPAILNEIGFPAEKVSAVLDAIRQHQPHDDPTTVEATILRDADILEQLGAIGILRTVSKVGRDTRFPHFTEAVAALRRNLDQLPSQLRLESARRLAEPRIAALHAFLQAVDDESGPNLF